MRDLRRVPVPRQGYARAVRPRLPLIASVALARAAASVSRFARTGAGTTIPGRVLTLLSPDAVERLARRLPQGAVLVSATNGKTTTAAMAAEVLGGRARLAHNRAGANLVSGVASALLSSRDAELGLFEVDEGALPNIARTVRPRVLVLGNLFRDQLDRYGELELVAERWRGVVSRLPKESTLVANADDPQIGDLARLHARSLTFGIDDPRHAHPALQHAADSKWCIDCGTPYEYAAAYVGHLGDYRCPSCGHARPSLAVAAREIELGGLDSVSFELSTPDWSRRLRLPLPGIYNVYNALAAAALVHVLGVPADQIVSGLERFSAAFGRFERIELVDATLLLLLIKNPAGANEVVRTLVAGGPPSVAVVALNDDIADGRDVSWIWDVDFEPLLGRLERVVATGDRAAELALRFVYGGMESDAVEVVSDLEDAFDRGLELIPAGGELVVLPTYTAMLDLQAIVSERGYARPYWERAA